MPVEAVEAKVPEYEVVFVVPRAKSAAVQVPLGQKSSWSWAGVSLENVAENLPVQVATGPTPSVTVPARLRVAVVPVPSKVKTIG